MSLSKPVERQEVHCRRLVVRGYRRADGLFDIEGNLEDSKPYPYALIEKDLAPGQPIHGMWLRLTVDRALLVHAAEAWTEHGPYRTCAEVEPNYAALAGLTIGAGWNRNAKARMGRVAGCTHMTEMLAQMAITALQTVWSDRNRAREGAREGDPAPEMIDTCHTYRADGPMVRRLWPERARPD